MSPLLIGVIIQAAEKAAELARDVGVHPGALMKSSEESIKTLAKEGENYFNDAAEDGWSQVGNGSNTVLYREYVVNPYFEYTKGMQEAVCNYFSGLSLVNVERGGGDAKRIITCEAKAVRSIVGLKLDIRVEIVQVGDKVEVYYYSPSNEKIRFNKSII